MSLIDDLEGKVNNAWDTISSTGAPAIIAGAENYAADQLKGAAVQNQAAAQAAVNKAVASGSPATGIMKSIQDVFGNVATGAAFKEYGLYIVVGLIVILVVGKKIL